MVNEKDFQRVNQKAAGKDSQMGYQKSTEMVGQKSAGMDSVME